MRSKPTPTKTPTPTPTATTTPVTPTPTATNTPVWYRHYHERAGGKMKPLRKDCYHKNRDCRHLKAAKTKNTAKNITTEQTTEANAIAAGYQKCSEPKCQ